MNNNILWLQDVSMSDVDKVGGKNASLGEMIHHLSEKQVMVPGGFATTAQAYREFISQGGLATEIYRKLDALDIDNVEQLANTGRAIRDSIMQTPFSSQFIADVNSAYDKLTQEYQSAATYAVRSSATAEDLPTASFAGQQETYLNVAGIDHILHSIKQVFASLFNDRAIAYRCHQNFDHDRVAISAGVQRMVRSDLGASGVMFSIDTESGFKDIILINACYGLGETVVQGEVNPDEFCVFKTSLKKDKDAIVRRTLGTKAVKMIYGNNTAENDIPNHSVSVEPVSTEDQARFCLSDDEITQLAKYALTIEEHYGCPMDIEWAKDGQDNKLYIVQARPETVQSQSDRQSIETYVLKQSGDVITKGRSVGHKIGHGPAKILHSADEMANFQKGDVLVADMTDPDWEPIMKHASAIVTNRGGRTCHAAIIARELGIPAVVGCGDALEKITNLQEITVSCAQGDTGYVYQGKLDFEVDRMNIENMPELPFKVMMNVGNPERAFHFAALPNAGVGLARIEFIISQMIGIHPSAAINYEKHGHQLKIAVDRLMTGYDDPVSFYVQRLQQGISCIAAAFYPKPVIVRLSDFKTNEYSSLVGGASYEPSEENPMLGFRGASRYSHPLFEQCFALECQAIKYVREQMGLDNVEVMIPFVRTLEEAKAAINTLASHGLERGKNDLRLIMMCELPSNALLAEEFLQYFDGFSIGSNDLTQLTLGVDRDSSLIASSFDERNPAVKKLLHMAIQACNEQGKYIGICGQGPSDYPDLAEWLMKEKIGSVSLNPDSVLSTWLYLAKHL